MYHKIYEKMRRKFDPHGTVSLVLSSRDEGLDEYFRAMNAYGSTHMEEDGKIYVKIHDRGEASKATWLEEYAHALQFLREGHIDLGIDDRERGKRELEVAQCLLSEKRQHKLSEADREHYSQIIDLYE